jgi:hypothetical protein
MTAHWDKSMGGYFDLEPDKDKNKKNVLGDLSKKYQELADKYEDMYERYLMMHGLHSRTILSVALLVDQFWFLAKDVYLVMAGNKLEVELKEKEKGGK